MLPQLTANLIRAEHLAVRASLQRRIKHGVCPARSSLLISVVLTGLTSLSWRHTWGTWTPPRCSWTCTRYSPNNHRLRALTAFLALRWEKNQTQNIVEKRSAFTAQNQSFLALCFQSDSCNKAAAMNSSVQELYPLTDVYLKRLNFWYRRQFLPCRALLVSHLQKYQINAAENDRCYGGKHAFIRRSAVVERNSGRWRSVMWYDPIQSPLR